jgi:hypothetical protein
MKRRSAVLLAGLISLLGAGTSSRAQVSFSAGIVINSPTDFTQPLTPLGTWITLGSYGRVWRPGQVAIGWRPYSFGRWEWTDLGWYWVSDEPWAWAVYHYGTWVFDPNNGWCWIPGTEWAPAWVSWRDSPDFIGWAPLGPSGVIFTPSQFVFVKIGVFNRPIRPNVLIVNNQTVINRTRVVNVNFRHETRNFNGTSKQVVVNVGPPVNTIAKATGASFTARPVKEVARETPVPEDVKRSGDIERPVLKEQNVQKWRQQAKEEGALEKQPPPTGRERPEVTPKPQQPESEQKKPEQQKPESHQPELQKPEPQKPEQAPPERPVPAPPKPNQARPEQPTPTPPQQLPPTGKEQPRPPEKQQTTPPATPDQARPERPTPVPQKPEQVRPDQSTPTPPQQPPPTGRDQPSQRQEQPTRRPTAPPPDQARPERPTPPPQNPDQARPEQSTPTPPQQPPSTGQPQDQQTRPPTAPPDQAPPQQQRPNKDKDNPQ